MREIKPAAHTGETGSPGKAEVHTNTKSTSFFEKNKDACGSLKNAPADLSYNPKYLQIDFH